MPSPPSPTANPAAITDLALGLITQAAAQRQRRLLLLCGEQSWGNHTVKQLLQRWRPDSLLWIGEQCPAWAPPEIRHLPGSKARQLLGQEFDALVFDAWDGFDPDAFGAVSGTLRAGGLLLLLTPPLPQWQQFNDPEHVRIVSAPTAVEHIRGRYLRRLARIFKNAPEVVRVSQQDLTPPRILAPPEPIDTGDTGADSLDCKDQQRAVAAVVRVATGHRRRPVVLTADRGRGKSAALGIAAAALIQARPCRIAVTGPCLDAVLPVLQHCSRLLPAATRSDTRIDTGQASLRFIAPDALLETPLTLDLLLVDEAAALPTELLQRLLRQYNRIAFATTVHGYEGSGRGFALRFNRMLDQHTRGWRTIRLETPIRWAADDPLEALTFRALLLDAEAAPDEIAADARNENCQAEMLNRDQLVDAPDTLSELFGLLVQSHYRTRPQDLRQLLDGSNVSIWVLQHRSHILGTALLTTEGGFDAASSAAIWAGRRRPRGHLLAETLSAHLGLQQAAMLRSQRIMRVAIHPKAQRRGLGAKLLAAIARHASEQGIDYLGSSFGADPGLLRFWQRSGYRPARISARPGTSSGSHSALMVRGLSDAGHTLTTEAAQRFQAKFPFQLGDHLAGLDNRLALQLLTAAAPAPETGVTDNTGPQQRAEQHLDKYLNQQDWLDLFAFGHAGRAYEDCLQAIATLSRHALATPDCPLTQPQRQLLMSRVLQQRPWNEVAAQAHLSGRKQIIAALRECIAILLRQHAGEPARQLAHSLLKSAR